MNPVRDLTPLETYDKSAAKALALDEMRRWLKRLDGDEFARRHDLPELSRFMLATGVRIGEALGVTWADVDLVAGVVQIQRTIVPIAGVGLVAKSVKSKQSERGLVMPAWCVAMLRARRSVWGPSMVRCSRVAAAVGVIAGTSARQSGRFGATTSPG